MAYDPSQWFRYGNPFDKTDSNEQQNYQNENPYYDPSTPAIKMTEEDKHPQEYDPSAPSISSDLPLSHEKPDPKKLDYYITMLQKFIRPLPQ